MLQQGLYVADVAYLLNEGAPSTMPFWGAGLQPSLPEGYSFDYINADVLLNRMSVAENGRISLPDGLSYAVLVLPETKQMTLPVLRKVRELVKGGAVVLGPRPTTAPGLTGYPASDAELNEIASEVWGDLDGVSRTTRVYGAGKVFWGMPLKTVLASIAVKKDFEANRSLDEVSWIHRRMGDTDFYYVANRTDKVQDLNVEFRVGSKQPELWYPDNGNALPVSYSIDDDITRVPLKLDRHEAVFVVFNKKAEADSKVIPVKSSTPVLTLDGAWKINFPPNWGAPENLEMPKLESWTQNADPGVKYFSGTATYTKEFDVKKSVLKGNNKLLLDLGDVRDIAEVYVNGKVVDTLWKAPYVADVSTALKGGKNLIEIKVTNQWTNRLIGDQAEGEGKRILSSYTAPFGGRYQLAESGLLGPVRLVAVAE